MDIDVKLSAVLVAAVAQFAVGAIWYMPLFGKLWGKIHGFDALDKKTQSQMQKEMVPMLAIQLAMAFITAFVLAHVISALPNDSAYMLAGWMWFGFVLPTQVSAVVFGGTKPKWVTKKIAVMAGGSLTCLMVSAWILSVL